MKNKRKARSTSSHYGLNDLGYTRNTKVIKKKNNYVNKNKFLKNYSSSDCSLQVGYMKSESLVIVN
jgi:hypothetical protein